MASVIDQAQSMTTAELVKLLKKASKAYYEKGQPIMSDDEYDFLFELLKQQDPTHPFLQAVGAAPSSNKVKLPYYVGSIEKIKPDTKALDVWKRTYTGPYHVSDKLDGMSGLLHVKRGEVKLFKRGDGHYGQDISHLLPHIRGVNLDVDNVTVRGELIMSKKHFQKLKKQDTEGKLADNARNLVGGLINSKPESLNKIKPLLEYVDFVTYELVNEANNLTMSEQFEELAAMGLKTAFSFEVDEPDDLTQDPLTDSFADRRESSKYEVDGLIVRDDNVHQRVTDGYPSYAFAYKTLLDDQVATGHVIEVEWNESKHHYLKPRIRIRPIQLVGVTVQHATGFNAKFIQDNKLGPGAVIKIVRSGDVIPHVLEVLKPAKRAQMPDVEYVWTKNHVDIMVKHVSKKWTTKQLAHFFKTLGVENVAEGKIEILRENGLDSVVKIIDATIQEIAGFPRFGRRAAQILHQSIHRVLDKPVDLDKLMSASLAFGRGFGTSRLKLILEYYPEVLDMTSKASDPCGMDIDDVYDSVSNIPGIGPIIAQQFVDGLPKFQKFLEQLGDRVSYQVLEDSDDEGTGMAGQIVVFTGFRDKELQKWIESQGGEVKTTVSSKTTIVVVKDDSGLGSSKAQKAKELGIELLTLGQFKGKYM